MPNSEKLLQDMAHDVVSVDEKASTSHTIGRTGISPEARSRYLHCNEAKDLAQKLQLPTTRNTAVSAATIIIYELAPICQILHESGMKISDSKIESLSCRRQKSALSDDDFEPKPALFTAKAIYPRF